MLVNLNSSNLETINNEPCIKDLVLAEALGFVRPREIRRLIDRNRTDLESLGVISRYMTRKSQTRGRPSVCYYLNRKQALFITAKSDTPQAAQVTIRMVEVFDDYMAGKAPSQPRLQHRPDAVVARSLVPHDQRLVVARRIQDLREDRGISRRDLAKKLGVCLYTISSWESSKRMPRTPLARKLAKALSVDVKDILAGEVLPPDQQPAPPPSRPQGPRLNDDPEGYYQKHIAAHKEAYREMQESLKEARRMFNTLLDQISQHNAAQFSHAEHAKACRRLIKAN